MDAKKTLRGITQGEEFNLKFLKTSIFKRIFGQEEVLIKEYYYDDDDECKSSLKYIPQYLGMATQLDFNKFDILLNLGVFHGISNGFDFILVPQQWQLHEATTENGYHMISYQVSSSGFDSIIIAGKDNDVKVQVIIVNHTNYYYRVELSQPYYCWK